MCQVADMKSAVEFYRAALGAEPETESPYWSSFRLGTVSIGLHPPFREASPGAGGGWILGFEVDDLDAFRAHLYGMGAHIGGQHEVPGGAVLEFNDPDGNALQAFQPGYSPAK